MGLAGGSWHRMASSKFEVATDARLELLGRDTGRAARQDSVVIDGCWGGVWRREGNCKLALPAHGLPEVLDEV